MDMKQYLAWVQTDNEKIAVKKLLVDIAGDLVAGIVLSAIEYWHLPSRKTGKTRLRVRHDGQPWLVKRGTDWYADCRISRKQADRALRILSEAGLIVTDLAKFNGAPTMHIRINWPVYLARIEEEIQKRAEAILPFGENRIAPSVENVLAESGKTLTDSTTESTSTSEAATRQAEATKRVRPRDLLWEAIFAGLHNGTAYVPGAGQSDSLANRIAKELRQAGYADRHDLVERYYTALRAKGLSPTKDAAKVVSGVIELALDEQRPVASTPTDTALANDMLGMEA